MNHRICRSWLALFVCGAASCDAGPKDCLEGYARDNQDRCQPIINGAGDTGVAAGNTPPTAPGVSLAPEGPREQGSPLVCRITTDSIDVDGDTVSYTVVWSQNDALVETVDATEQAGDTVSGARLFAGDVWECTVTPFDGHIEGPSTTVSATVSAGFVGWDEQWVSLSEADYTIMGEENENGGCLGGAMASAGDLDHDGKMDFVLGDFWWDNPETGVDAGKAYVFLGADLGANAQISVADAAWSFEGDSGRQDNDQDCEGDLEDSHICGGDWAAHSVTGGMDGDGDGTDDLLIVAYKSDEGGFNRGKIAFYSGGLLGERGTRSIAEADVMIYGETEGDSLGHSVDWAGDVDGDGIADVVTGAHGHSTTGPAAGRTYLMLSGKLVPGEELYFPDDADYMWDGEADGEADGAHGAHVRQTRLPKPGRPHVGVPGAHQGP